MCVCRPREFGSVGMNSVFFRLPPTFSSSSPSLQLTGDLPELVRDNLPGEGMLIGRGSVQRRWWRVTSRLYQMCIKKKTFHGDAPSEHKTQVYTSKQRKFPSRALLVKLGTPELRKGFSSRKEFLTSLYYTSGLNNQSISFFL